MWSLKIKSINDKRSTTACFPSIFDVQQPRWMKFLLPPTALSVDNFMKMVQLWLGDADIYRDPRPTRRRQDRLRIHWKIGATKLFSCKNSFPVASHEVLSNQCCHLSCVSSDPWRHPLSSFPCRAIHLHLSLRFEAPPLTAVNLKKERSVIN